jgi:hypothetical protein
MKRTVHPQPDWWFVGGRMQVSATASLCRFLCRLAASFCSESLQSKKLTQAGDTPAAAAARNTRRETSLDLPPGRFTPLCTVSMVWQKRKQPPEDNGTADISVVFLLRVSKAERAALRCHSPEHSAIEWVAPEALAGGEGYHPALRR